MNTTVWTQNIMLSRPRGDRSVGLAGRQCHCVMTQNVCLSAVYEVQIWCTKDRSRMRICSVQKCGLYKNQMSISRGPPVYKAVCLVPQG